jgi:DNA-binding NarL/FixJ family response regulator
MSKTIRVFLADDHTLVREGIAALLAKCPDMEVVGECGDGMRVVEEVVATRPDVVVLDLGMPGLNGVEVCRLLTRKVVGTAVLVVTMYSDEEFIVRSLENGAVGYLLKEAASDQLAEAVRTVARGDLFLGPGVPRGVLNRLAAGSSFDPYDRLTSRERQVLQLIAEGKTSRQVAEILGVAAKTVGTHRAHLMQKLKIHDQTALLKLAIRRGLVQVPQIQ